LDIADLSLNNAVAEVQQVRELVNTYTAKAEGTTDAAEKSRYTEIIAKLEPVLSNAIMDATKIVGTTGAEIAPGTDGFKAMTEIGNSLSVIKDSTVLSGTMDKLNSISGASGSTSFKTYVNVITKR
jgi:hypothetical protein